MTTPTEYADRLAVAFLTAYEDEPQRFGSVRTWEDLDAVADANDFLQEVDDALGTEPDSYVDPDYVALTTNAIAAVEAWIAAPKRRVEVLGHVNRTIIVLADNDADAMVEAERAFAAELPDAIGIEALHAEKA